MIDFAAFKNGDEDELGALVLEYSKPIIRYCYSILCNYSDADDAAQLTFIKTFYKRETIKDETALASFIFRVAYRTCLDIIRKRRFLLLPDAASAIKDSYSEGEGEGEGKGVGIGADGDFPEGLREALLTLSPKDRALVYDRAVNEMSYSELAGIYKKPEATLRKRYERARNKMAAKLEREDTQWITEV
jgi:RNA polymerase sigma-70 factor (ECF subfamily)